MYMLRTRIFDGNILVGYGVSDESGMIYQMNKMEVIELARNELIANVKVIGNMNEHPQLTGCNGFEIKELPSENIKKSKIDKSIKITDRHAFFAFIRRLLVADGSEIEDLVDRFNKDKSFACKLAYEEIINGLDVNRLSNFSVILRLNDILCETSDSMLASYKDNFLGVSVKCLDFKSSFPGSFASDELLTFGLIGLNSNRVKEEAAIICNETIYVNLASFISLCAHPNVNGIFTNYTVKFPSKLPKGTLESILSYIFIYSINKELKYDTEMINNWCENINKLVSPNYRYYDYFWSKGIENYKKAKISAYLINKALTMSEDELATFKKSITVYGKSITDIEERLKDEIGDTAYINQHIKVIRHIKLPGNSEAYVVNISAGCNINPLRIDVNAPRPKMDTQQNSEINKKLNQNLDRHILLSKAEMVLLMCTQGMQGSIQNAIIDLQLDRYIDKKSSLYSILNSTIIHVTKCESIELANIQQEILYKEQYRSSFYSSIAKTQSKGYNLMSIFKR